MRTCVGRLFVTRAALRLQIVDPSGCFSAMSKRIATSALGAVAAEVSAVPPAVKRARSCTSEGAESETLSEAAAVTTADVESQLESQCGAGSPSDAKAPAKKGRKSKWPVSVHAGPAMADVEAGRHAPAASMAAFIAGLPAAGPSSEGSGSSSGPAAGAGAAPLVKILSWNANGLRAALGPARKADVQAWLAAEAPDILCIQETKIDGSLCAGLRDAFAPSLPHAHFTCCAEKKGYAGTAIFSREAPLAFSSGLGDGLHDAEGRVTTAEYAGFYVVNVCVSRDSGAPRGQRGCGGAYGVVGVRRIGGKSAPSEQRRHIVWRSTQACSANYAQGVGLHA